MESTLKIITLDSNHGLPSDQVHAIAQDSDYRIWFASPAGLSRYDGRQIRVFDNFHGLQCQGLRAVEIYSNIVWIGTDQGLESIYTNGTATNLIIKQEWNYGLVQTIASVGTHLWIGSAFGLIKFNFDKTLNQLNLEMSANVGFVRALVVIDEDTIFAASGKGLIKSDGKTWSRVENKDIAENTVVFCLHKSADNRILVGTDKGLFILSNTGHTIEHIIPQGSTPKVTAIASSDNEWWLDNGSDILVYEVKERRIQYKSAFSIGSSINAIFVDAINNIWVGSNNGGVKKISCLRQVFFKIDTGIEGAVYSIKKADNLSLRIGGETYCSNLSVTEEEHQMSNNLFDELPAMTIWDSCNDPADPEIIWLATQEGLCFTKRGKLIYFESDDFVLKSPARCLLTCENDLYVGTLNGLARIRNGIVKEIRDSKNQNLGYVYSIALDKDSVIWIATLGRGLWQKTEKEVLPISPAPLSSIGNTYAVVPNHLGDVIVIQDERIILLDKKGRARLILQEYPIAGWSAVWMDTKTVLVGSNDGLLVIDLVHKKITTRINPLLGKSGWQFTCSRSLFVGKDLKAYCGLNIGLYMIDLKGISGFANTPKLTLDEVVWENVKPIQNKAKFLLKPGKWSMEASVFSAWFIDEELIRFRFKLVGFDADWSAIQQSPKIKYTSLPPGKYLLNCQVHTPLTGFGETTILANIEVSSPWWTLGLISSIQWISKTFERNLKLPFTNRKLIKRNKELELEIEERKLISKELESKTNLVETLIQTIPDLIWLKDNNGVYLKCNAGFERFFGAQEKDILGKTDYDFVDKEQADFFRENDRKASEAEKPLSNEEFLTFANNSYKGWFESTKIAMRDKNNNNIGVLGIARDISARKNAEKILLEKEHYSAALFEYAAVPIWVEDFSLVKKYFDKLKANGVDDFSSYFHENMDEVKHIASLIKVIEINKKNLELYGANTKEELITSLAKWFNENSWTVFREELVALAQGNTQFIGEISIVTPSSDIKQLILYLSVHPDHIDSLKIVFVSFVDITDRKHAEMELAKYRNHLEELVVKRTKELDDKNKLLERINIAFSGREIRMAELKKEIEKLKENRE